MDDTRNNQPQPNKMKTEFVIPAVVVLAVIAVIAYQAMNKSEGSTPAVTETITESTTQTNSASGTSEESMLDGSGQNTNQSGYTSGTYTAEGEYITPGGAQKIEISLTIEDGVVVDSQFVGKGEGPITEEKQADFGAHYQEFVIGKNIDEIRLTKVSGSSLTPNGFHDALEKIKAEAKA